MLLEEQQRLPLARPRPVTMGEARRAIQRRHRGSLLVWLHTQVLPGVHLEMVCDLCAT
jgi:hypothetical protein